MASQHERIAALLDQLGPLGRKRRGMPIEADEWNDLVGAVRGVLEVASAQDQTTSGTLEQGFARTDHDHPSQVTDEWLASDVRARLEGGGTLSEAVAGSAVGGRLDRIQAELARVQEMLADQQARIDRMIADGVDRSGTIRNLRDEVIAVGDLRGVVARLDDSVGDARSQLRRLGELRNSLTDASGNTIDVAAIREDVQDLRRLRASLTDESGRLIRIQDVVAQVNELGTLSGGAGIDDRIRAVTGEIEERLNQRVERGIARFDQTITDSTQQSRTELLTHLDAAVESARVDLDRLTDGKINAAEQRLDSSFATGMQSTAASLRGEFAGVADSIVTNRLGDVDARVSASVEAAQGRLTDAVRADVLSAASATVDERVGVLTTPLAEQVNALDGRLGSIEGGVDATVDAAVTARFDAIATDLDGRVTTRFEEARAALGATVNDQIGQALHASVGDLDQRIGASVATQLQGVDARIDQSVANAAAALPDTVRNEVLVQLSAVNVPGQLDTVRAEVTNGLRAELAAAETRLQANQSTAINDAVVLVRNDFAAANSGLEQRLSQEIATTRLTVTNLEANVGRLNFPIQPIGPVRPDR